MSDMLTVENLVALLALTGLEVVLGIDNVVFIAVLAGRLDPAVQARARRLGLLVALVGRIALLLAIGWIARLTTVLFTLLSHGVSGRDLIMLGGGLFLIAKATYEIHHKLEGPAPQHEVRPVVSFRAAIVQILLIDHDRV